MELAALVGTLVSPVIVVMDPVDIHASGRYARFVVAFKGDDSRPGLRTAVVYRRLTPQVPALGLTTGDAVSAIGPLHCTALGGMAVEAETLSLADVPEVAR